MNVANLPYLRPRRKDIFTPLPPEVQEIILKNLRPQDIMACCQVCKSWNEILSTKKQIWMNICQTFGFNYKMVENEATTRCKEWFLFMKQRVKKAKKEGLKVYALQLPQPKRKAKIEAFHVNESLIAIATSQNSIQVHKFSESVECVLDINEAMPRPQKIMYLRVDGTTVAAMQYGGTVSAWNIENGYNVATYIPLQELFCFDLWENTLIVALGGRGYIQVSNISSYHRVQATTNEGAIIGQTVMPRKNFENLDLKSQFFLLFACDYKNVFIFKMENISTTLKPEIESVTCLYTIIPPRSSSKPCISDICYDGSKYLYCNQRSMPKRCGFIITKFDVATGEAVEMLTLPESFFICSILGAGKEFILFLEERQGSRDLFINVAPTSLKKYCLVFRIPCEIGDYPFRKRTFIGLTEWLNGLDESNDRGFMFGHVATQKSIYLAYLPQDKTNPICSSRLLNS